MFSILKLPFLLIFLSLSSVYAGEEIYHQNQWLRLLGYEKSGDDNFYSKASEDTFFISKNGRRSPREEWLTSIESIKERRNVGRLKTSFDCAFPARFEVITKVIPSLMKYRTNNCTDFQEWVEAIGAKEVYITYASSYVSNPASMFGHSLLRLSRGGQKRSDALLDYSVGFLAITNPNDNAVMYTLKGVTGQYNGFFEIKPFYMNVGLYQNSEDRDLWQYRLPFNQKETNFLLKVLWELSTNTGFPYYFFDENCSYYILKLLEIVKSDWNLLDRTYLFAHPIETIKWLNDDQGVGEYSFLPSINRLIRKNILSMTQKERRQFTNAKTNLAELNKTSSKLVLDTLIDYWKHRNYKAQTLLNKKDKELMNATYKKRASLGTSERRSSSFEIREQDPLSFHRPNKLSLTLNYNKKVTTSLSYDLGYQNLSDSGRGHDDYSYIDYFGFELEIDDDNFSIEQIKIIDIISFAPFLKELPRLSWRVAGRYDDESNFYNRKNLNLVGGIGLAYFNLRDIYYSFFNIETRYSHHQSKHTAFITPSIEFGIRSLFKEFIFLPSVVTRLWGDDIKVSGDLNIIYDYSFDKNVYFNLSNEVGDRSEMILGFGVKLYH